MGFQATQPPSSGSSAAAAANPHRMLLAPYAEIERQGTTGCSADPNTVAAARTSDGHLITVSLRPAPPPALPRICVRFPELPRDAREAYSTVIVAHGDSVVIYIVFRECCKTRAADYFVYDAGATGDAARPPSLSLLPPYYCPTNRSAIGLLRRGEAELVVAELRMVKVKDHVPWPMPKAAELLLFRSGEWRVSWPRISHDREYWLLSSFETHAVMPLGRRMVCWVDFAHGVIFSDVFADSPTLRLVPYPEEAVEPRRLRESHLCVTTRGEVKLVCVSPRPFSDRGRSEHASAIDIWTLKTDGIVAWVMETVVDESTELWVKQTGFSKLRIRLSVSL